MHGAAVVPQDEIAHAPFVVPFELFAVRVHPQLIEQRFGLLKRQSLDVGVAPAPEIQDAPLGFGMRANQRMKCPGRCDGVVDRGDSLPHVAAAVVGRRHA